MRSESGKYGRGLQLSAVLSLVLGGIGCATLPPLTGPRQGGAPWHELETKHFVMDTDVDAKAASERLVEFETLYAALHQVSRAPETPGKARVVVFDRRDDFGVYAGPNEKGYFSETLYGDPDGLPTLVFANEDFAIERIIFLHELGHRFNHARFFSMPLWLDEGLAEYGATLTVDGKYVHIGGDNPVRGFVRNSAFVSSSIGGTWRAVLNPAHAWNVDRLLGASNGHIENDEQDYFYASAWRLVQMLENGPDARLQTAFQVMLSDMQAGKPSDRAFEQAFGADHSNLQMSFQAYLNQDELGSRTFELEAVPPVVPSVTSLGDADVHVVWAKLAKADTEGLALAQKHLDLALASAPDSVEVRFARAVRFIHTQQWQQAKDEIDRALRIRPEDPRLLLISSMARRNEREAQKKGLEPLSEEASALLDHLGRNAKTAIELDEVAISRALVGDMGEANKYVEAAIKRDPGCTICWLHDADLLAHEGRLDEARVALTHLTTLVGNDAVPEQLRQEVSRLVKSVNAAKQAQSQ